MERYIIGSGRPAPYWCRDKLMPYRGMDGSTGVEFYKTHFGAVCVFELHPGDVLIHRGSSIEFKRKSRER